MPKRRGKGTDSSKRILKTTLICSNPVCSAMFGMALVASLLVTIVDDDNYCGSNYKARSGVKLVECA